MKKLTVEEKNQILAMPPEAYMNAQQQDFFLRLLQNEREELLEHIEDLKSQLQPESELGDEADVAAREEHLRLVLRQIDRESRLLPKFDAALLRLHKGEYGYCKETGDPIGVARLILRPTAELSFDAKIKQEHKEGHYRK